MLFRSSDGISEAVNHADEEFSEARIFELVAANRDASAAELIEKILQEVSRHAAGQPQMDDMTLVVIQRQS